MGLRFRRSFKVFPGVRLNVSRGGLSTSFGVPGATVNVGKRGVRGTVGIPGSGLSYSTMLSPDGDRGGAQEPEVWTPRTPAPAMPTRGLTAPPLPTMRVIGSLGVESLTSPGLVDLRQMMIDAREQRGEVEADLSEARREHESLRGELTRKKRSWFRSFFKARIAALEGLVPEAETEVERLEAWRETTHIDVDFDTSDTAKKAYAALVRSYEALRQSQMIWDVTADRDTNRVVERSAASRTLDRTPVKLDYAKSDLIKFDAQALGFGNANGEDILIYPGMILMPRADGAFALLDLRDVDLDASGVQFIESEQVPDDAKVVDQTWAKVNKDGSRDKRFQGNYQIPVCLYGKLKFTSASGLEEEFHFSNVEGATNFGRAYDAYRAALS